MTKKLSIYFVDAKHAFDDQHLFMEQIQKAVNDENGKTIIKVEVRVGIKMSSHIHNQVLSYLVNNRGPIIFEADDKRWLIGGGGQPHHVRIMPYAQEICAVYMNDGNGLMN